MLQAGHRLEHFCFSAQYLLVNTLNPSGLVGIVGQQFLHRPERIAPTETVLFVSSLRKIIFPNSLKRQGHLDISAKLTPANLRVFVALRWLGIRSASYYPGGDR